ncbi:hypothetical protein [uncultured Imperialibacter sp.]|uniref:hypothetical protein n=1 Tax=uncultured Imperialibacter sp. TaxID=1672639 RepID=UPI0030D9ABD9|tara:strand:- start:976 stop:1716 length:741 start_codon:yes stop_codon:yes gene_type:complete
MRRNPFDRIVVLMILMVVTSCDRETIGIIEDEVQIIDSLVKVEGYLSYQDGVGYLDYILKSEDNKPPVSLSTTVCDDLPDSLKKNTRVLFDGDLIAKKINNNTPCVTDFKAIDLCGTPYLSLGFDKQLHPICVTSSTEINREVADKLITTREMLDVELALLGKELNSPIDFAINDVVFLRRGVQPSGWDIQVDFSRDETTKKCIFRHIVRDWSHTKVGGGLNFFYAIPNVPDGYSFEMVKETRQME